MGLDIINKLGNNIAFRVKYAGLKLRHLGQTRSDDMEPLSWRAVNVPVTEFSQVIGIYDLCKKYEQPIPASTLKAAEHHVKFHDDRFGVFPSDLLDAIPAVTP